MDTKIYGLIGRTLKHSFSKGYFTSKFEKEEIKNCSYELFELLNINQFTSLIGRPFLAGLNVTIPYKQDVIPFLSRLDWSAQKVGAVNVIKIVNGELIGYNSDYYGFKNSLKSWLKNDYVNLEALVLGTGGASKAVVAVLDDLGIKYKLVSRKGVEGYITYTELHQQGELVANSKLIINTTPVGMFPDIENAPDIPYDKIQEGHYLYDLVYNPEFTSFMRKGENRKANTKNGLEMLHLQAEKSWEIWNNDSL